MGKINNKKIFSQPQFLLILLIILGYLVMNIPLDHGVDEAGTTISFFDVGQGDASLIRTNNGQSILIDGGPSEVVVSKLDKNFKLSKKELSAVIITHPHADHIAGLISVLDSYDAREIYFTGVVHTSPEYIELLRIIKDKGIKTHIVKAGDTLEINGDERVEFLYPGNGFLGQKADNLNNSSVVVRYVNRRHAAIFLGDLEKDGQESLLKSQEGLKSDILKVAHHGSKDSVNNDLVKQVDPVYAVISVGKDNKFGHPNQSSLDSFRGRKILRTDMDGDIVFSFNKNGDLHLDRRN